MNRHAIFAALRTPLSLFGTLDFGLSCPPTSKNTSGHAAPARMKPNGDGVWRLERDRLQARLDAAKPRSEAASLILADLRRVTLECLRRGV